MQYELFSLLQCFEARLVFFDASQRGRHIRAHTASVPAHIRFHAMIEFAKLLQIIRHSIAEGRYIGDALQELPRMQGDLV